MKSVIFAMLLLTSATTQGAGDFGISKGAIALDCDRVSRQIARDWLMLKDHMAPGYEGKRRPRNRDFQCVDSRYMRDLIERRALGAGRLRCFANTDPGYGGFCCDTQLQNCAMFGPR